VLKNSKNKVVMNKEECCI